MSFQNATPVLKLSGITKTFPGVRALDDVSLELFPGEIHALIGENGAGKSTLLKVMFGSFLPNQGTLELNGLPAALGSPAQAKANGISMVHQEVSLVPQLNAIQNIVLGRERSVAGFIDWRSARKEATAALQRLEFTGDPEAPVGRLSIAQQQIIELARAIAANSKVIIMDEPTASLSSHESDKLFEILRDLRRTGHAIVYVSHRLKEVFELADRATVLRDGRLVGTVMRGPDLTERTLIQMMVGRGLDNVANLPTVTPGELLLEVSGLTRANVFRDISFTLRRGEIVGMAGMVGAGRTEVVRGIVGADPLDAGQVTVRGKALPLGSPAESVSAGIAFLTEDRKHQGLALHQSLAVNVTLAKTPTLLGFIRRGQQRDQAQTLLGRVGAKMPVTRLARQLSGGNQQKVVLAKWLLTDSEIFIFDEPTRGIDVGAKSEIYAIMRELAENGAGVLMISSELPELLRMSDRILVMREGALVGELTRPDATEEVIVAFTSGEGRAWLN
jgi:ABC-type sugar transport system ATPase subunit